MLSVRTCHNALYGLWLPSAMVSQRQWQAAMMTWIPVLEAVPHTLRESLGLLQNQFT